MPFQTNSAGDSVRVDIDVESDAQDARNAANEVVRVLRRVFEKAFQDIGDDLTHALSGSAVKNAARNLGADLKDAAGSGRVLHGSIESLEGDMAELAKRSAAFKQSLDTRGVNKNVFSVYEVELGKLLRLQDETRRRSGEILNNPELAEELNQRRLLISKAMDKEAQTIRDTLHLERTIQHAETQGGYSQRLAETKIAGQRLIQQERQTSRARIEIFRAAQRQILFLEKQLAAGLSGAVRILKDSLHGIGTAVGRVGSLFRRSNHDLNEGLRGALLQREGAISRSFGRQTTEVRSELLKQSRTIERFNQQSSKGVIGAATGRSSVGAALGLGAGIGGGFALFQGLREGIKVGGDFVQGLAVLGAQLDLTEAQMQGVREQSIELGNDISLPGVSALDAAEAIQILAKQFANLGDAALPAAQAGARGVLQLARAAGVDAEEAARVVGAAVNIFKVDADEAVTVADQITNALTKSAGVGFNDFADAFTQSAGIFELFTGPASEATDTLAEFNAAIAVLAKNGLIGSDAGTSLKQFLLQANRGTADAKKQLNFIADAAGVTGSVFFDAAGGARSLGEALEILRKGTKGLTDQDLTTRLSKLFGSDAARAAAFLIKEPTESFAALTEAIQKQGSAAEIAAAQNTGLRGAMDALQSVIETQQIKTYERYQAVLGRVVIKFAELLQQFFDGEGKMGVLRAAITGVAVALGSLLILKTVVEGFKLLAIALTSVATPLGLVVTGLAVLGGAIGVLRKISPEFRAETEAIADTLRGKLGDGAKRAGDLLATISHVLRTEVVPRFIDFGVAVASKVLPVVDSLIGRIGSFAEAVRSSAGLQAALSGVRDVINGLRGASSISPFAFGGDEASKGEQIGTQIRKGVQTALHWLDVLRDQVQSALATVKEALQPAITQFENLARAIQNAFQTGDTSLLTESFVMMRDGILSAFQNLGVLIIDTVRPQLEHVVDFLGDTFSPKNLQKLAIGIAQIVFKIGETLGTIASDPRVVAALEGLVVAITVVGGAAVAGFAKGVVQNLPEIAHMLVAQFQFLFNEIFEDGIDYKKIAKVFVIGLATAMTIGATLAGFKKALKAPAEKAGVEAGKGFVTSMGRQVRAGLRRNDFASGFIGFEKFATDAGQRAARALEREQGRAAEHLRLLSGTSNIGEAFIGNKSIALAGDDAIAKMQAVRSEFGEAAVAGGILRGRMREVFIDVGNVADGVRKVFTGVSSGTGSLISSGFGDIRSAGAGLARNLARVVREVGSNVKAAGIGVGQALGGAIVSGVGAALSGKALGESSSKFQTGLGIAGILSSALFGAAAVGGGAQGVVVGTIIAGVGAITAITAAHGRASKKAAAEVAEYADALREVKDASEFAATAGSIVRENLQSESDEVRRFLRDVGFDSEHFADQVIRGTFDLDDALATVRSGLGRNSNAIIGELKHLAAEGIDPVEALKRTITNIDNPSTLNVLGFTDLANAIASLPTDRALAFADALDALLDESGELREGLDIAGVDRDLDSLIGTTSRRATAAREELAATKEAASQYNTELGRLNVNEDLVFDARMVARADIVKTTAENLKTVLQTLNDQRLGAVNEAIGTLTTQLEAAKQMTQLAKDALTDYLTSDYADTAREAVDNVISGIGDVGTALTDLGNLNDLDLFERVKFRQIDEPFKASLAGIIQKARTDAEGAGIQFTPELLANLPEVAELRASVTEVTVPKQLDDGTTIQVHLPKNVQDLLLGEIDNAINNPDLATNLEELRLSEEAEQALRDQIAQLELVAGVRVFFSEEQIRAAAQEAGLFIGVIPPGTLGPVDPRLSGITDPDAIQAFLDQKAAFDSGVANGTIDPVTGATVNNSLVVNQTVVAPTPIAAGDEIIRKLRTAASGGQLFINGTAFAGAA